MLVGKLMSQSIEVGVLMEKNDWTVAQVIKDVVGDTLQQLGMRFQLDAAKGREWIPSAIRVQVKVERHDVQVVLSWEDDDAIPG